MHGEHNGGGGVNYWPAVLDMLAAALMVFVLATYVQTALPVNSLEMIDLMKRKDAFVSALEQGMRKELARGEIDFIASPESMLIRFSDQVLFDVGKYELKKSGKTLLGRFGQLLAKTVGNSVQRIQVDGHTDDTPIPANNVYPADNWELSRLSRISWCVNYFKINALRAAMC